MKKLLLIVCLLLLALGTAEAQVVTVDGVGTDEVAARRDAARTAVEQVVGTYIASRTLVSDYETQLDEIYAQSQGFVKSIQVLSRESTADGVRIRASVDVDTTPDGALMGRLETVTMLSDPRIAVVIFDQESKRLPLLASSNVDAETESRSAHDSIIESALTARLLEVGFHHVVDANQVARLDNSALLNSVYQGTTRLVDASDSRPVDDLVLGKCDTNAYPVKLPDGKGGYHETQLKSATATLACRIVDYATGNIVGTFTVSGQGVDNEETLAANKARQEVGKAAAEALEKKFRTAAEQPFAGIAVIAKTADLEKAEALADALRALPGVQNVYLRGLTDGRARLDVESAQKPYVLAKLLKEKSGLKFYVSDVSASELRLTLH